MKNEKIAQAYGLIHKALKMLPTDNDLQEARYHLRQACSKINKTQGKHLKQALNKAEAKKQQDEMLKNSIFLSPSKRTFDIINAMLEAEKDKLDEILKNKENTPSKESKEETLFD